MHKAFKQVCTRLRLTGAKAIPVIELVAIRIVELASDGEFDPDKLSVRQRVRWDWNWSSSRLKVPF
jgi:hypothetical protein